MPCKVCSAGLALGGLDKRIAAAQAFYKILMGYRPSLPLDMPPGYRSVMTSCWSSDPAARPGFDLIIKCLQVCACFTAPSLESVRSMLGSAAC